MKLASFRHKGRDCIGFSAGDGLIEFGAAARAMGDAPSRVNDMLALIESGDEGQRLLSEVRDFVAKKPKSVRAIKLSEIEWLPPVRRPSKISRHRAQQFSERRA